MPSPTCFVLAIAAFAVQAEESCPVCIEARAVASRGDTAAAVVILRNAANDSPGEADLLGLLGLYLVQTAPSSAAEFEQRKEGEELLWRAIDLGGEDPRWWYGLGVLARKRGLQSDARRFFLRATDLVHRNQDETRLSTRERARILVQSARALEEHVLDFQGLVPHAADIPVVETNLREGCPVVFCLNFERPGSFHEILLRYETLEEMVAEDRAEMRSLFGEAFLLEPGLDMAARGWLGELARSGEWEAYAEVARRHVEAAEDKGWALLFQGAGLWRMGAEEGAEGAFARTRQALSPSEVRLLDDVTELVRKGETAEPELRWTVIDPLLLTERNERRLEHWTRFALAELWFGEPRVGRRGAETDRGILLIRYGEPRWIRQLAIEDAHREAIAFVKHGIVIEDPDTKMVTDIEVGARQPGGGRWVLWTYSEDAPSFVFEKQLGARRVLHAIDSPSKEYEEAARHRRPSSYRIPNMRSVEHQVARFKGTGADVEADVVVGLPTLPEGRAGVEGEAAFFLIPRRAGVELARLDARVELVDVPGRSATFRVPVNAGRYPYAVEVLARDRSVVASTRDVFLAEAFPADGIALSDLLLARSVRPRSGDPRDRRDFLMTPAADLTFEPDQEVGVYFEIYGLEAEAGVDVGGYRVQVAVERGDGEEGTLAGVVRRLSDLLARADDRGRIEWMGSYQGAPERIPEWFTLRLQDAEPGTFTIEVTITEPLGDRKASASRTFRIHPRR